MGRGRIEAPARRLARAGALIFVVAAIACDDVADEVMPQVLELANDTIVLDGDTDLVEVVVRRTSEGDFEPLIVQASTGDVVRFTAGDNGGHAIVFDGAALPDSVRAWLDGTAQLRSPPLIETDAAWVVTLEGAPTGEYPFRCTTHNAGGRMTVGPR